ncbi:hypothetical protein KY290_035626 [Solanum tuberosum]|uniref:F-box associated beta-propeller type 3 domain-containing protein n=1 Tax=Solanum tuberosum TaxID=4113 RepID=A0ABQ7TS02_SOLTU|nr:hypothetical protein KY285_037473 [Solanum tuberosum]KAH0736921.1 hypothetical protein KY290_035626 [Solanum tuberosum]
MGDEIDDIEFARHMLRLKRDNKKVEEKNRGMKQVKNNQTCSNMSIFPESIVFQFLIRIPARYIYKNFMPVCKSWKEMFSQRSFAELNFAESKTEFLLIQAASSARHMKTKLLEIGKDLECESCDLGINRLGQVRSSCDGFLLINNPGDDKELQVINPTTKICITIPKCPSGCHHKDYGCSSAIGFDSRTKQFKVVHVVTDSYGFEIFNLNGANDESHWKRIPGPWADDVSERPFNPLNFRWKHPVSINGRILHWYVDSSEYIISMQVNETKFSRTYLPKELIQRGRYELVELGGFLSIVYYDSDTRMDVWNLEGECWFKKHSIMAKSINYISPKNVKSSSKDETSMPDIGRLVLVDGLCPKNVKSSSKYEISMPDFGKFVPVAGVRNGEMLILKHKNSNLYVYDMNTRVMKKVSINMKNIGNFIAYKDSLFTI